MKQQNLRMVSAFHQIRVFFSPRQASGVILPDLFRLILIAGEQDEPVFVRWFQISFWMGVPSLSFNGRPMGEINSLV